MTTILVHLVAGVAGGLATVYIDGGKAFGPAMLGWCLGIITTVAATAIAAAVQ